MSLFQLGRMPGCTDAALRMNTWRSTVSGMVVVSITKNESGSLQLIQAVINADLVPRRKRTAREAHHASAETQKMFGHKAKLHHAKRHAEKVQMKKTLKAHDERNVKQKDDGAVKEGALPTYLLDREGQKVWSGLFNRLSGSRANCFPRMPKLFPLLSKTEERIEQRNMLFLYPK